MASSEDRSPRSPTAPRPTPRPTLRLVTAAFLAAVILVAAGVAAWAGSGVWSRQRAERETGDLRAVAVEVALLLSSLSSADARQSLDRLEEISAGSLREEVAVRRAEVLEVVDDDEVTARAEVIASGVERPVAPRGPFDRSGGPATATLLVATRAEVSRPPSGTAGGGRAGTGERLWRWRIEAVIEDGRALVSSAEVAV